MQKGEIHKYKDIPPPPPSKQEEGEQHDRKGEEEISTIEKKKGKAVPPKGGCVPSSIGLVFRLCSTLLWVVPCVVRPFLPVLPGGGVFTQFTLIERLFSFRVVCLSNISFLLAMCSPFVCKLEYNNHMVNVNVEKGLDLILEKGRRASDVWAAHLTCQAPCRPSVPFFTTAPHAIRKAFVRDVRGMDKQTYSDSAPPESASRVRGRRHEHVASQTLFEAGDVDGVRVGNLSRLLSRKCRAGSTDGKSNPTHVTTSLPLSYPRTRELWLN